MNPIRVEIGRHLQQHPAKGMVYGLHKLQAELPEIIPPTLLVILCLLFFHSVLIGDEYFLPWDFQSYFYPVQGFVDASLRSGQFPLWDPYIFLGYPIVGDPQASIFHPVFLLYHLMPWFPPLSLKTLALLEILCVAGAGVFTYLLAREIGLQRSGGFFAGLVFMLGGFFPPHMEHETWVVASAWIPLLFFLANRMFKQARPLSIVSLGLVVAFSVFSGHPQTTLQSVYVLILFLVWQCADHIRHRKFGTILRNSLSLFGAFLLGLGISSIQLLPSASLTLNSTRGAANFAGSQVGGLDPAAPVTWLLPQVFGSNKSIGAYLAADITDAQKYFGLFSLVLIGVALIAALRQAGSFAKRPYFTFFLLLALIALIGSFGDRLYLYRIFELLPFTTLFRRPSTLFPFALLGMTIVGGMVCDHLATWKKTTTPSQPLNQVGSATLAGRDLGTEAPSGASTSGIKYGRELDQARVACVLAVILAAFYLIGSLCPEGLQAVFSLFRDMPPLRRIAEPSFAATLRQVSLGMLPFSLALLGLLALMIIVPRARPRLTLALVGFTFLDLYTFNAGQIFDTTQVNPYQYPLPGIEMIHQAGLGRYRIGVDRDAWLFNMSNVLGVEDLGGYNPLMLSRVNEFLEVIPSINSRLFDLLNVKYLILARSYLEKNGPPQTFADVVTSGEKLVYIPIEPLDPNKFVFLTSTYSNWFQLWENRNALPRFIPINQFEVVPDSHQRLAALGAPGFDPERTIILEEPINESFSGQLSKPVRILEYRQNTFEIETSVVNGSTLLFVSVPYYQGWNATVDGQPAHIYIADHAFMAVRLAPGNHAVRFAFEPVAFELGAWITSFSLALCLLLLVGGSLLGPILRKLPRFFLRPQRPTPGQWTTLACEYFGLDPMAAPVPVNWSDSPEFRQPSSCSAKPRSRLR